jgi:hypothetical protein
MAQNIRGAIDQALKIRGLPVECHHASWRDGGFSYPSLLDRREVLLVRLLTQMMLSKDEKVREATQWFMEEEQQYRGFPEDQDSNVINWSNEHGRRGTGCLATRARKTC